MAEHGSVTQESRLTVYLERYSMQAGIRSIDIRAGHGLCFESLDLTAYTRLSTYQYRSFVKETEFTERGSFEWLALAFYGVRLVRRFPNGPKKRELRM